MYVFWLNDILNDIHKNQEKLKVYLFLAAQEDMKNVKEIDKETLYSRVDNASDDDDLQEVSNNLSFECI